MPGFIGVGAGKWTTPSVIPLPAHPEIYAPGIGDNEVWVGHTDKSVSMITLPVPEGMAGIGHWTSLRNPKHLYIYGAVLVPGSDPAAYIVNRIKSEDGGATWGDLEPLPFLGSDSPDAELGELDLYQLETSLDDDSGTLRRSLNGAEWASWYASDNLQHFQATTARVFTQEHPDPDGLLPGGPISALAAGGGSPERFPLTFLFLSHGGDDSRVLVYQQDDADHRSVKLASALSLTDTDLEVGITNDALFYPFPVRFADARCNELGTWILSASRPTPYDGINWFGGFESELWRSPNGTTWTKVYTGLPAFIGEGASSVPTVGYCTDPSGVWWAGGFSYDFGPSGDPDVQHIWLRSPDDGLTWETVQLPSQDPVVVPVTPNWVVGGKPDTRSQ